MPLSTIDSTGITSPVGPLVLTGVTDGSNALAGTVGEFVYSAVVASASGLTSGTPTNVTSISLTAGDWDVQGAISFNQNTGTSATYAIGSVTTTSATNPGLTYETFIAVTELTASAFSCPVPSLRVNVTTTTTVYLVGQCNFSGGTIGAGGFIRARRVR